MPLIHWSQNESIDEGTVQNRLNALERGIQDIKDTLDNRIEKRMEEIESRMVRGFEAMDRQLEKIADVVGVKKAGSSGDDDEDRKRLKERLNEALEVHKHGLLMSEIDVEGWLEYFFGICKPNGRFGKHGSRCAPPRASHLRSRRD
jgi:DNA helicase IV